MTRTFCPVGEQLREARRQAYEDLVNATEDRSGTAASEWNYRSAARAHRNAIEDFHDHLAATANPLELPSAQVGGVHG